VSHAAPPHTRPIAALVTERRSTVQELTEQGARLELPTFNARALREGRPWRWAVLAPGDIAADFTRTLHGNSSHRVVAGGSRSPDRARAFASKFGVDRSYGSYRAAVADSAVDAVYVAAPNRFHAELAPFPASPIGRFSWWS